MKHWYSDLENRFGSFPESVQVLHLLSDLTKARNLLPISRKSAVNHYYRAIILLDYIVADPRWRGKLRELLRLREAIGSLCVADDGNGDKKQPVKPYGTPEQIIKCAAVLHPEAYKIFRPSLESLKNTEHQ